MGYGVQHETFGCERLLADSSYTDLCSSKYDERGGIVFYWSENTLRVKLVFQVFCGEYFPHKNVLMTEIPIWWNRNNIIEELLALVYFFHEA